MSSSSMICSSEWKTLIADGRKRLGISQGALAKKLNVSDAYIGHFEVKGWVPARKVVEKVAEALSIPVEDALLAAGYSNQNVSRGYRRYLEAVKTNSPMKSTSPVSAPAKIGGNELLNAFSQLIDEHESMKASNAAMSTKLNKILEAVK